MVAKKFCFLFSMLLCSLLWVGPRALLYGCQDVLRFFLSVAMQFVGGCWGC